MTPFAGVASSFILGLAGCSSGSERAARVRQLRLYCCTSEPWWSWGRQQKPGQVCPEAAGEPLPGVPAERNSGQEHWKCLQCLKKCDLVTDPEFPFSRYEALECLFAEHTPVLYQGPELLEASRRVDGHEPSKQLTWQGRGGSRNVFHPVLLDSTQSWYVLGTLLAQLGHRHKHGGADRLGRDVNGDDELQVLLPTHGVPPGWLSFPCFSSHN